jgi:predicted MPP superfamily phosphohydrolase
MAARKSTVTASAGLSPAPQPLTRRRFLGLTGLTVAGMAAVPGTGYLRASNALEVTHTTLELPGAGPAFRILLVADVHAPQPGLDWDALVRAANAERPDLVLIAGDAINARGDEGLVAMYAPLEARVAKLAVPGNWENWARVRRKGLRREYESAGVIFLDNGTHSLDELGVHAIGLDERTNGWPKWDLVAQAPVDRPTLLLHHSPSAFATLPAPAGSSLLMVSGHTHGGQVAPFGRPWLLPPGTGPYVQGAFRRGAHQLYVTRGIGNSHLPFRLGSRPELAVIDVRRAAA